MTNKLQHLQQQVAAHMAAKEARTKVFDYIDRNSVEEPSKETIKLCWAYHPDADAAMQSLSDLLPVLEAVKIWSMMTTNPSYEIVFKTNLTLLTEAAKLLMEVEE